MNIYLMRIICLIIGYAFGCLQWAYIFGWQTKKIDIRNYGSGNSGTTNALRVLGKKWGILTLVGDILKTVIAMVIVGVIFGFENRHLMIWAGFGAFIGHNHPFYMQFKGGKGVAVMIGLIAAADPLLLVIAGVPALILLAITKYVSLASISYMTLLIIVSAILYLGKPMGLESFLLITLMALTTIIRHKANISRLLKGTERKLGQRVEVPSQK